jgi:hypothetical protein
MEQAAEKKPSRWEAFLGWLEMLDQSPEERIIEYLQQVELRLQQLERSLPQGRPGQ